MSSPNPRAKRYEAIHNTLYLVEISLTVVLLVLFLTSGLSGWLARHCAAVTSNFWGQTALFSAAVILAGKVLFLPLNWLADYHLEYRFGLSRETPAAWIKDELKSLVLNLALGIPLLLAVYGALRHAGHWWWLWAAGVVVLFSTVMTALMPIWILPLFYKLQPLDNESLRQRLERLAQKVGARIVGVYRIVLSDKTRKANAAFAGLGPTKRILLGDTLLNEFAEDEIEVIMAHEMAHYRHGDLTKLIAWSALTAVAGFAACEWTLQIALPRFGLADGSDLAGFPLLALTLLGFGLIVLPARNAFSRWRERLADRAALDWTGNPDAFIRALQKLADQNLADLTPNPLIETLLHSHPSPQRRIHLAQQWKPS